MSIVVIGKNSFLASHLARHPACADWVFLSHDEALSNTDWLSRAHLLINFAFSPQLQSDAYDTLQDIDGILAEKIEAKKNIHYIMLSSRIVYGQSQYDNFILKESQIPKPNTAFGLAKLKIEQSLIQNLGKERLTILRLGNIFGFEPGRATFFGTALRTLQEENRILLNSAPDSLRDFIAVWHFVDIMLKIAANPQPGLYNIGAGFGTPYITLAEWLIEGFGKGEIITEGTSTKGQFWMDMSKTKKTFDISLITPEILARDCISLGYQLRKSL